VPAAAVIPAPVAYIKVVAVKTFVVEIRLGVCLLLREGTYAASLADWIHSIPHYLEKIRVFQAGVRLNIIAWNNKEL
jgi:hypothetical protein